MIIQRLSEKGLSEDVSQFGVEFSRFLSRLDPDAPDTVLAAGYLAACAIEDAHTCLELEDRSLACYMAEKGLSDMVHISPERLSIELSPDSSRLIGTPGQKRPLIVHNHRLYINRYWAFEERLASRIRQMASCRFELPERLFSLSDRLFPPGANAPDWQKLAALNGCRSCFSVISGGPGTGKTRTVAALMALLAEAWMEEAPPQIALCAPTGKAVARLNESISSAMDQLDMPPAVMDLLPRAASTVHRLLGRGRVAATYRYHADNPLQHDVIIVDEASMLDLTMMVRLVDAMRPDARLVLIGDKDQLASVEAGSVLSDICWAAGRGGYSSGFVEMARQAGQDIYSFQEGGEHGLLSDCMVVLRHNYRFGHDSGIYQLAQAVNQGNGQGAEKVLDDAGKEDAVFINAAMFPLDRFLIKELAPLVDAINGCASPEEALRLLETVKVLCAVNDGSSGTRAVNEFVCRRFFGSSASRPFRGLPIIIRQNDYSLGLYNGDSGIVWQDEAGNLKAYFMVDGEAEPFSISRLPRFEPAWAITVHVSQGSEFDRVLFLLPQPGSVMAGRELFYTAITRARNSIAIYGSKLALTNCVQRPTLRMSGLKELLL